MAIKIVSVKKNPLLNRREVNFLIDQKVKNTPSRIEIKKSIASEMKVPEEMVFIKKTQTLTGSTITIGIANIYQTKKNAELIEPNHIKKRNKPKEKEEEVKEQ